MNRRDFLSKAKGVLGIAALGAGAVAVGAANKPAVTCDAAVEGDSESVTLVGKMHFSEQLLLDSPRSITALAERLVQREMRAAIIQRYPQMKGRICGMS